MKIKTYTKKNEKLAKESISPSSSLPLLCGGIYRVEMDKEMSRKIGGAVYSEFESSPYLQT